MIDGGGAMPQSGEAFDSGHARVTLLSSLREPVDRGDRLDVLARVTAVTAGVAVLAALPLDLYTLSFGGGREFSATAWGRLTQAGADFHIVYRPPVYGYLLASAAAVLVLGGWAYPRCVSLALAVLAGCTGVLYIDVQALGAQETGRVTMGPSLPIIAGAVALACLLRTAHWARASRATAG